MNLKLKMSPFALPLLMSLSALPALAQKEISVPLTLTPSLYGAGTITAPCEMDELKMECLLDTGANVSSLRGQFKVEKQIAGTSHYKSATGEVKVCNNIKLDHLSLSVPGSELALEIIQCEKSPNEKSRALIGLDYMKAKILDFELPKNQLIINSEISKGPAYPMQFDSYGHPLMVAQLSNDTNVLVMWDSGAGLTLVANDFVASHPDLFFEMNDPSQAAKDTHGNAIASRLVLVKKISFGPRKFVAEYAMAIDFSNIRKMAGKDINVMLGFNIIAQANWRIDFTRDQWSVY